ncbi:hypothetical protein AAG747_15455 [Rapidithrix thailandica]|uniref:Uncharacterized protein n=1 Tax=Rapidithrix thailandica TaxID=413964 RepID=A0AAW9SC06_9BACT
MKDFKHWTPRNFFNALEGYRRKEQRKQENEWQQTRLMITYMVNIHRDTKKKISPYQPEDILTLPGDQEAIHSRQQKVKALYERLKKEGKVK